jgi:transcriptional regulator GlxA family with amidase domain
MLESIAQAVSIHIVRRYTDPERSSLRRRIAIPAYLLRHVTDLMQQELVSDFDLRRYAHTAGMSEAHFSRQFKRATGLAPSHYFIRLRMALARENRAPKSPFAAPAPKLNEGTVCKSPSDRSNSPILLSASAPTI